MLAGTVEEKESRKF